MSGQTLSGGDWPAEGNYSSCGTIYIWYDVIWWYNRWCPQKEILSFLIWNCTHSFFFGTLVQTELLKHILDWLSWHFVQIFVVSWGWNSMTLVIPWCFLADIFWTRTKLKWTTGQTAMKFGSDHKMTEHWIWKTSPLAPPSGKKNNLSNI